MPLAEGDLLPTENRDVLPPEGGLLPTERGLLPRDGVSLPVPPDASSIHF
jgi:hypothetical protein